MTEGGIWRERVGKGQAGWVKAKGRHGKREGDELPEGPGWECTAALRARCGSPWGAGCCAAVDALVAQYVLPAPKALAALPAGEGPRARVCLAVAHKVLTPVEGLAAFAARVWLLARRQRAQGRARAAGVCAAVPP